MLFNKSKWIKTENIMTVMEKFWQRNCLHFFPDQCNFWLGVIKIKSEIVAEIETTFGRDHTLIIEGHEKL